MSVPLPDVPRGRMGTECKVHRHREWVPTEDHHIFPKGYGGPNVASNRVLICANAHGSVHYLLDAMLRTNDGRLPWSYRRRFGKGVRRLAERGYAEVMKARASQ